MSPLLRAGSTVPRTPPRSAWRRRSVLGLGALAAAGLATLAHRAGSGGLNGLLHAPWARTRGSHLVTLQPAVPHRSPHGLRSTLSSTLASTFSSGFASLALAHDPAMAALTPPQAPPAWTHAPDDVRRLAKEVLDKDRARMDAIAALKPEECTFETVRRPLCCAMCC